MQARSQQLSVELNNACKIWLPALVTPSTRTSLNGRSLSLLSLLFSHSIRPTQLHVQSQKKHFDLRSQQLHSKLLHDSSQQAHQSSATPTTDSCKYLPYISEVSKHKIHITNHGGNGSSLEKAQSTYADGCKAFHFPRQLPGSYIPWCRSMPSY